MTAPIRVLHVDDDAEVADLTATYLAREGDGITVATATSADEGLDRIRTGSFDCVVSDYEMPGMDGIELLEAVREEYPDLPFILYTGKGSEAVASDAISAGVTDYLQKASGTEQYQLLANRIRNAVERTRAERSRKRHLEAIETAREGISILDSDGEFIYVNEAYAELYGYDPEEMIGEHWELIYPDDEVETVRGEVLPLVEDEGYWHGETSGLRADGTTFPEDHVVSRTDRGDLVCTVRDLSDRRSRQAELRLKDRVLDEAPIGITVADPAAEDNPLIYVNDRFEELTGHDAEEIIGTNCRFLQGEHTREEPVAAMREAIAKGEPVTVELRNYRKDGTEFWNHVTIAPLLDDDGTVERWLGFQEDVTERKERDRERAALEHGIEHIGVGVASYDADGRIRYANEQYAEMLGTTRAELTDSYVWELNPELDAERFEAYWNSYDLGETRVHETVHERVDTGERIPTETTTTHVRIDDTPFHIGTITDITDRKAHEQQLQREVERLDKFASIVSHDLRNPLNVAQGRLELLAEEYDSDHIPPARNALDRMNELITDTLTLAREGRIVDETESVSLGRLAEESWRNADTGGAVLDVVDDPTIHADPQRLRSILENLFRNAVEHGSTSNRTESDDAVERGSTSSRTQSDDAVGRAGDVAVRVGATDGGFYVEDDGPGIPEADREGIFEAGFSTADGSSGFGLTIVREIAEAHGWTVTVTDGADGGARFEFTGVTVET
ncbi:hybrid sensor histidine kinase/response regulator [Halobellus ruber]|uniref:histidine kinase n=1 Tax=Halobellus ruber TaxID=2761102 RepID=A0A7J9SHM5_9EURY|nr:PAS domain S-box protein [Halobellus ruber]MBB6646465.1 PAS domain S-box protein [Halobellus ruber]